jgi:hypothetical protein
MERGCRKVISLATFVFYRDIVHFDGATESKGFEEEGEEEEEEEGKVAMVTRQLYDGMTK